MRTTVRIDDDLLRDLKQRAQHEKCSLTSIVNKVIRHGLRSREASGRTSKPFRQKTYRMGPPLVDVAKALALAAQLEDEEIVRKLGLGK